MVVRSGLILCIVLDKKLDEASIFVWDGNYYALEVTTHLGLEDKGGMGALRSVAIQAVVYNTLEEIRRFGEGLGKIAGNQG